jgi:hypothetical protein
LVSGLLKARAAHFGYAEPIQVRTCVHPRAYRPIDHPYIDQPIAAAECSPIDGALENGMADRAEFSFTIKFARGRGDPRRVFDAASLLIEGFEELDDTIAQSIDAKLRTTTVLDDVETGSLRVILRTILENIDDQGLKEGEWKKAIGPALVRGKHLAIEALNRD